MSSKNRKARDQNPSEYFPTPAWCVDRFLEKKLLPGGRWLEPCAGHGDIIAATNAFGYQTEKPIHWTANELRTDTEDKLAEYAHEVRIGDYLAWEPPHRYNVSISNPPFSIAMEVILKALEMSGWVVMLLRLNYLGTTDRNEFFQTRMPDIYVIPERPSFDGKGTDSIEYAWFVWGPGALDRVRTEGKVSVLNTTPLEIRNAQKPLDLRLPEDVPTQASLF